MCKLSVVSLDVPRGRWLSRTDAAIHEHIRHKVSRTEKPLVIDSVSDNMQIVSLVFHLLEGC